MWSQVEPRQYERQIEAVGLIKAMMTAMVMGLPGLRAVADRCGHFISDCNFSALSHALRRESSLGMVQALLEAVAPRHTPGPGDLVAIDSMPLTLPATLRHGCAKVTRTTVGGGMLWAFVLNAAPGINPVRIIKTIEGAWSDSVLMKQVDLDPNGPIYLMDRGFYAIDMVARWIGGRVNFIVRAKRTKIRYEIERVMGPPRMHEGLWIFEDVIAILGRTDRKIRPRVRLVRATLGTGEELILVSGMLKASAEKLAGDYRQRWQIERFHYYLKETLGLAHLYSFQQAGIAFLAHVAVLLCVLLLMLDNEKLSKMGTGGSLTVDELRVRLRLLRRACGMWGLWRRNTMRKGQTRHRKKSPNP